MGGPGSTAILVQRFMAKPSQLRRLGSEPFFCALSSPCPIPLQTRPRLSA